MMKTSLLQCSNAKQATTGDAMTYAILDFVAVISLLLLGLLTLVFRRRIFRPVERLTIGASRMVLSLMSRHTTEINWTVRSSPAASI